MPAEPINGPVKDGVLLGEAKAHRVGGWIGGVKSADRHRRDADLGGQIGAKSDIVAVKIQGADIGEQKIRASAVDVPKAGTVQAARQPVAFGLQTAAEAIEIGIGLVQSVGHRALKIGRRGEDQKLMGFGDRRQQRRGGGEIADLPAGHRKSLAGRADFDDPLGHARQGHQGDVPVGVINDVLISLVAHDDNVMGHGQFGDGCQFGGAIDFRGWVLRRVKDQEFGLVAKRRGEGGGVQFPGRRPQLHRPADAAGALDNGHVAVIAGLDQDHFVARFDEAEKSRRQGFGGAGGDHHLALPIDVQIVKAFAMGGDRLTQFRHAQHRRVLVGHVE